MKLPRPTPQQERWLAIAARFPALRGAPALRALTGEWNSVGLMTRVALFALGAVIAMTTMGIVVLLVPTGHTLTTGVLLAAAAEWLIARRRLCDAGIEEALIMGGYLALATWLAEVSGIDGDTALAATAAAVAYGAAGWRLRNPLCTTLMALSLSLLAAVARDPSHNVWTLHESGIAPVACYAMAAAALCAGACAVRRPSTDRMLDWLVVVLPVAGYLWSLLGAGPPLRVADLPLASLSRLCVPLAPLLFATVALVVGLRRRTHAPLIAAMLCGACVAFELRELTGLSWTARLLLWGSLLLLLAIALERLLRSPRRGITSRRLGAGDGPLDLLPVAGAAMLGPQARPAGADGFEGQGGGFGGGGASGQY